MIARHALKSLWTERRASLFLIIVRVRQCIRKSLPDETRSFLIQYIVTVAHIR